MKVIFGILSLLLFFAPIEARVGQDGDSENHSDERRILRAANGRPIRDSYIIQFRKTATEEKLTGLRNAVTRANGNARIKYQWYAAYHGMAVEGLPEQALNGLMNRFKGKVLQRAFYGIRRNVSYPAS